MPELSDPQLVVRVAGQDQEALAELYCRHSRAVYGLARRVTGQAAEAQEVCQEVFLRLWSQPERFDPGRGSLRTYLLTQTHGLAVDTVRSRAARRRREERAHRDAPLSIDGDFERQVWDLALADRIDRAMTALPSDEKEAIELAYFGGHTYREVATLLSEPEGTIKSRIRAGLRRMRSALVEDEVRE